VCRPADGDPVTSRSPLERLATAARERTGADADGRAVLARFKELAAEYFGGLAEAKAGQAQEEDDVNDTRTSAVRLALARAVGRAFCGV
jgi:hypothetical protein